HNRMMRKHNIGMRLGAVFSFLIAVLIGIGWLGQNRMGQIHADMEKIVNARWAKVQLSREALNYSTRNSWITMEIYLSKEREKIDPLLARRAENSEKISDLLQKIEGSIESEQERELLANIEEARTPYVGSHKQALDLLINEKKYEAAGVTLVTETLPRLTNYDHAWNAFVQFQGDQMD